MQGLGGNGTVDGSNAYAAVYRLDDAMFAGRVELHGYVKCNKSETASSATLSLPAAAGKSGYFQNVCVLTSKTSQFDGDTGLWPLKIDGTKHTLSGWVSNDERYYLLEGLVYYVKR